MPPHFPKTSLVSHQKTIEDQNLMLWTFSQVFSEVLDLPELEGELRWALKQVRIGLDIEVFRIFSVEKNHQNQDHRFTRLKDQIIHLTCRAPSFGEAIALLDRCQRQIPNLDVGFRIIERTGSAPIKASLTSEEQKLFAARALQRSQRL